jgi:hypothetical protein
VPAQKPINAANIARQCRRSTSADDHLSFRHRLVPLVSHSQPHRAICCETGIHRMAKVSVIVFE